MAAASGCEPEEVWRTPLGVRMLRGECEGYFTPEEVDAQAQHALSGLMDLGVPQAPMRTGLGAERLWMFPESFGCPTLEEPSRKCNGMQLAATLAVAETSCVWNTALQHEMLHHLLEVATHDADADHQWAAVWALDVPLGKCAAPAEGRRGP